MATFSGTTQKRKACEKTVYLVDQLTADNKVYHKACFRCHHCKGTLKLSNYCSFEGVLYCKPHFDQLFKITGSLDKSFGGAPKDVEFLIRAMSVAKFQDCLLEPKTSVWLARKLCTHWRAVDGTSYHKACFKCSYGGCIISPSNFVAHEHKLYCKHHHSQLFKDKGDFSQLDKHEDAKEVNENAVSC